MVSIKTTNIEVVSGHTYIDDVKNIINCKTKVSFLMEVETRMNLILRQWYACSVEA